jgi:lysozyme
MVDIVKMEAQLVLHEGLKLHMYLDTEGYDTLGVGYNVSSRGLDAFASIIDRDLRWKKGDYGTHLITKQEALKVCRADILRVEAATRMHLPFYDQLDLVRQRVVIDMAFNMGLKALGFRNTIAAAQIRDWSTTTREMYKSKWSRQVGDGPGGKRDRVDRLAQMVLTGQEPTDIPAV